MSFREKSAWLMGAVILLTGLLWSRIAVSIPSEAPPISQLGALVPFVIAVIVLSIVVQAALAIFARKDANKPADEREILAIAKAGHWSGIVLAFAMVAAMMHYLWYGQGNALFHWVVAGLILAQIAEYGFQIFLFRRGH